ncbi:MAG: ABC transporter permease, partial [Lysobacter sp.]|nr:ABC transporter permease [Lysobacter sp.]
MAILPILSTLRRHKTAAALIVLEIALSCAIICNALFLISNRLERMDRVTGLAETELVRLRITGIGPDDDAELKSREDIAALRAIPGVTAATSTNQVPFGNSSWNSSVNLTADQDVPSMNAAMYMGDEQLLETFGLRLAAGRDFAANEYVPWKDLTAPGSTVKVPSVILTRAAAENLFPNANAIGQRVYVNGDPLVIVGVIEHLIRPSDNGGPAQAQFSMILPIRLTAGTYVLRTSPERRAEVQAAAVAALERINPNRIITDQSFFTQMRDDYYRQDRSMAWLLVTVCFALLIVTALGIV